MAQNESDDEDKLDEDIFDTTKKLESLDQPDELAAIPNFDPAHIKELTKKIQKMPKGERAKLLEDLTISFNNGQKNGEIKSDQMFNHDFKTVTEPSRDQRREQYMEKLRKLQMRRKPKAVLNNMVERESKKQQDQIKKSVEPPELVKELEQKLEQDQNQEPKKKKKKKKKKKAKKEEPEVGTEPEAGTKPEAETEPKS